MKTQSGTTDQRRLGGHQQRAASPEPTLRPENYSDKTHQQASQQFTSKPLWH